MSLKIITALYALYIVTMYCSASTVSAVVIPGEIYKDTIALEYRNVTVYAPAVGQTEKGYVGVISTITVTIQNNGSGRVFVDTLPLAQIDMQGSARLAVKVASALVTSDENCEVDPSSYDYFFVIRTESPIIGGPSAGGIMTAAVVSLLEGWQMDDKTVMTGMINPDGSIGPIGGIPKKIDAAHSVGAKRFLIPEGQMTYTDTITETTTKNGWIQTITRTITRNVSEYAMENYGIEVVEVSDINDVLLYYTGHIFPVNPSKNSISTEDYIDSMKPLATNLLSQANTSFQNASKAFYNTSIPNYFPNYYRNEVTDFLNEAKKYLEEAEDWYQQQLYYTSTTQSFNSLIMSRFVTYACGYFNSDDKQNYIEKLLMDVRSYYEEEGDAAKKAEVTGAISLQCVGAAQNRATEAEAYLSSAEQDHQRGDDFTALYKIAFALERSRSIGWWLGLTQYFNDTGTFTPEQLETLANDYIQDAQQSIVYSGVILQEMGKTSGLLSDAEDLLETAKTDNNNGYPAAALFEALEALSKGNLALELVDATTQEKIESKLKRANESASASISESRLRGIEPVLAVSYYELAKSYVDDNVQTALFYYKFSDLIPGVLTFTGSCSGQSSRYVGIPESTVSTWDYFFTNQNISLVSLVLLCIAIGATLGLLIGIWFSQREKEKLYNQWVPRSILDYQKERKTEKDNSIQMPRSIKDYYKKTK